MAEPGPPRYPGKYNNSPRSSHPRPPYLRRFPHSLRPTTNNSAHTHRFIERDRTSGTRPFAIHPNFPPECMPWPRTTPTQRPYSPSDRTPSVLATAARRPQRAADFETRHFCSPCTCYQIRAPRSLRLTPQPRPRPSLLCVSLSYSLCAALWARPPRPPPPPSALLARLGASPPVAPPGGQGKYSMVFISLSLLVI